ncbi:MAG: hypothetical protein A3F84_09515 [Candidatus Handelsmanbacteria bacterium RIFCSPLOWO2_12_FULL_64_10]|uniref:PEGA domain-containing protein n=1 Tax=Handelsmanbacteria sp. (strain RIFCSPLOWO2_12_FULL_64_10) TaxID=1817868 RepID=A0A1F6C4W8_HANXR|nr:MAG: hypothetical protein A3F84_09515 [Candidatus Handelsmanbacteria bacterium RIFCSPLOWO2_12_FULL_64_10]
MKPFVNSQSRFSALVALTLMSCLLFQTGCATIFQGRTQTIEVTSDPPGAKVFVNGKQMSTTPVDIMLHRKRTVTLRFEKEGYDPYEIRMKRTLSVLLLPNLAVSALFGGFSGKLQGTAAGWGTFAVYGWLLFGTDFLTGSAFEQSPSIIEAKLSEVNKK